MAAKKWGGLGGMRPGAGRKPKPIAEKQRNRVMFTLTDGEYEKLLEAAGDEPVGTAVRHIIVRYLARRRK